MDELNCVVCHQRLTTSTGRLHNNVWTVWCPSCKTVNRLEPDPNLGGKLVAKLHKDTPNNKGG